MALAARGSAGAAHAPPRGCRTRVAASAAPLQLPRCAAAAVHAPARLHAARRPRALSCAAPRAPRLRCRAAAEGLVPHESSSEGESAAPPLDASQVASVQLPMARRRTQMSFTCNKCGVRSTRMVNPEAIARGTVFVQCAFETCGVWHKVADALDWWGDEYTNLQGKDQDAPTTPQP